MSTATITSTDITGLILAGGRGSRMGGVDKGLQSHRGLPLVRHALQRLSPQVGQLMINANRNLEAYEALGVPVWPDAEAGYPGPLAGLLVGLAHCGTPYLVSVPCDTPNFPLDLVGRLARALVADGAELAMAATREPDAQGQPALQLQPVFCLLSVSLKDSLAAFLQTGQRKIDRWTAQNRCAVVVFDDAEAFANANTPEELQALQASVGGAAPP